MGQTRPCSTPVLWHRSWEYSTHPCGPGHGEPAAAADAGPPIRIWEVVAPSRSGLMILVVPSCRDRPDAVGANGKEPVFRPTKRSRFRRLCQGRFEEALLPPPLIGWACRVPRALSNCAIGKLGANGGRATPATSAYGAPGRDPRAGQDLRGRPASQESLGGPNSASPAWIAPGVPRARSQVPKSNPFSAAPGSQLHAFAKPRSRATPRVVCICGHNPSFSRHFSGCVTRR